MRRRVGFLFVVSAALALVPARTPEVSRPAPTKRLPLGPEMEVIALVNQERTRRGLRPLAVDSTLMAVSENWSRTQASRRRMFHSRNGYGENVAFGQPTPASVMQAWMNSRGHRQNILSNRYDAIGVGYVVASNGSPYWTQSFN